MGIIPAVEVRRASPGEIMLRNGGSRAIVAQADAKMMPPMPSRCQDDAKPMPR